ncbi:Mediator of RNA polymerase II transcription subunit 33A [Platanthera guangdongensis]|uniref:Mediator of RNA polymerase II transcription subunit 33A n=1 Tax=Platanthera guangdongensis TaxID=2320717 RepID=A0ABR2MV42_9ASPA
MLDDIAVAWSGVGEFTKAAQEKGTDAAAWVAHLQSELTSVGVAPPSPELAHVLISHLCWANDVPLAWKYMEKALDAGLAPPMLFLALLSSRSPYLHFYEHHIYTRKSNFRKLNKREKEEENSDFILQHSNTIHPEQKEWDERGEAFTVKKEGEVIDGEKCLCLAAQKNCRALPRAPVS